MRADARLQRVMRRFLEQHMLFSALALRLAITENESVRDIATDGRSLFYHPEWVADPETGTDEIRAAIAHVAMACALKHHTRRGDRDPARWQRASHIATQPLLHGAGLADQPGPERVGRAGVRRTPVAAAARRANGSETAARPARRAGRARSRQRRVWPAAGRPPAAAARRDTRFARVSA